MRWVLWLLIICFPIHSRAQTQDSDSLVTALSNADDPALKVRILNGLTLQKAREDPNLALTYSQQALEVADQNDLIKEKAEIYLSRGDLFYQNSRQEDALYYYAQSLNIFKQVGDPIGEAEASLHIGQAYYEFDDYVKALEYGQESKRIFEENQSQENLARAQSLMCNIYFSLGGNDQAISICFDALKLFDEVHQPGGKVDILNSLGTIYLDLRNFDRAQEFFIEALTIAEKLKDTEKMASSYNTIGDMHLSRKDYDRAEEFFSKALEINQQRGEIRSLSYSYLKYGEVLALNLQINLAINQLNQSLAYAEEVNDLDLQARALSELGKAHSNLGEYQRGIDYLKRSLVFALKINARPILQTCYQNLAKFYDKLGDIENAFVYFNLYMRQNEEIYTRESAKRIAESAALYELDGKEKLIQLLRIENEIQDLQSQTDRLTRYFLIAGLILVSITVIVVFSRYRLKIKANRELEEKNQAIQKQKEEIEVQKNYIETKNEEIQEIHDQLKDSIKYARRIQLSLLPENKELLTAFPNSFIFYSPKDIVSGDFYWFAEKDNKKILATVDCTGHGVPGAFMTVLASTLLNNIVLEGQITDPNLIITLLDQKVQQHLHQNEMEMGSADGMDIALCTIDESKLEVSFTGAKLPMYYVHNNVLEEVKGDRFSVGSSQVPDKYFKSQKIKVKKGDTLYFSSDGFQDQFGGVQGKKFMKAKFRDLLIDIYPYPMEEQYNRINKTYHEWKNGCEQTDDILVVGIRL